MSASSEPTGPHPTDSDSWTIVGTDQASTAEQTSFLQFQLDTVRIIHDIVTNENKLLRKGFRPWLSLNRVELDPGFYTKMMTDFETHLVNARQVRDTNHPQSVSSRAAATWADLLEKKITWAKRGFGEPRSWISRASGADSGPSAAAESTGTDVDGRYDLRPANWPINSFEDYLIGHMIVEQLNEPFLKRLEELKGELQSSETNA